ncbi:MAG: succinate dehydrogenase, cytochrome b556 subunit [Hyphomicrobiaceae bacterium]
MADASRMIERPLSPHLQIYRRRINMVMSILHRITGMALTLGSLLLAWWLVAVASGPDYYNYVSGITGSWLGRLVLLGFTWALVNHMLGGVRHLIWDTGAQLDIKSADRLCWISAILSVVLTAAIWIGAYWYKGAF